MQGQQPEAVRHLFHLRMVGSTRRTIPLHLRMPEEHQCLQGLLTQMQILLVLSRQTFPSHLKVQVHPGHQPNLVHPWAHRSLRTILALKLTTCKAPQALGLLCMAEVQCQHNTREWGDMLLEWGVIRLVCNPHPCHKGRGWVLEILHPCLDSNRRPGEELHRWGLAYPPILGCHAAKECSSLILVRKVWEVHTLGRADGLEWNRSFGTASPIEW